MPAGRCPEACCPRDCPPERDAVLRPARAALNCARRPEPGRSRAPSDHRERSEESGKSAAGQSGGRASPRQQPVSGPGESGRPVHATASERGRFATVVASPTRSARILSSGPPKQVTHMNGWCVSFRGSELAASRSTSFLRSLASFAGERAGPGAGRMRPGTRPVGACGRGDAGPTPVPRLVLAGHASCGTGPASGGGRNT
jgi:hypothetical protein